jgi:hypothetical protein
MMGKSIKKFGYLWSDKAIAGQNKRVLNHEVAFAGCGL